VQPRDVLDFWFGNTAWQNAKMWYELGRELDPIVTQQFQAHVDAALAGKLNAWAETPSGRLALIVVCDQFTRHVYRDDVRFTDGDARAQELAVAAFDAEEYEALRDDMVMFLFMPLEHSEIPSLHHRAFDEIEEVAQVHPGIRELTPYLKDHRDIVERFGRFPDRNFVLGRPSTPQEVVFLAETHHTWFERQAS
jgi:uncharacterized protein (DUF924 family)